MSEGYEALTAGVALWQDPDRVLLRVHGPRAAAALNGLLSADLETLSEGQAVLSFLLTSKGRPVALPGVIRRKEDFLLDLSRAALPGVREHFATYLPPRFARVELVEDLHRVSVLGPGASEAADAADWPTDVLRVTRPVADGGGTDLYLDPGRDVADVASWLKDSAPRLAAPADHEAWRIELGIPRYGVDVTEDNLPQETGLVPRAVSFEKGCYTGQEVVARIHYRGHVNRLLRGIRYAASSAGPLLRPGEELMREDRSVGRVTSACLSPRFGPIALAYVRRELGPGDGLAPASDPSARLEVADLPFTYT